MLPFLNQLKNDLAKFLTAKQTTIQSYQGMTKMLDNYEELNLNHYVDMDSKKLLFNNPLNKNLKDNLVLVGEALRNPFTDLFHWVKGEVFDIVALQKACAAR